MRVEIVQELEADDHKLEIPWTSPADPTLRYVDLKSFLEKVDELVECRQHPALSDLLRQINAPGSSMRSAKCDVWATTELSEDERVDFGLPFKMGSYVDLAFERPQSSSRLESHLQLGERLKERLAPWRVQAQMEIAVRHCLFHPDERWGYYATIFVHAYGANAREAEEEWSRAISALGDALAGIDAPYPAPGVD